MTNLAIETLTELAQEQQTSILKRKDVTTACEFAYVNEQDVHRILLKPEYRIKSRKGYYDFTPLIGEIKPKPLPWTIDEVSGRPIMKLGAHFENRAQRAEYNRLYDKWEDSQPADYFMAPTGEIVTVEDEEVDDFDPMAEIGDAMSEYTESQNLQDY